MTNSKTTNHKEALVAETDIPATPKDACIFLSDYAAWLLGCGATCIRIEKNVKRMADRWNMTSEMTILPSHIHMTVWNDDRSHSYSNIVRLHHTGISFDINTQLSKLSWAIADRKIGFTEALRNFEAIVQTRPANPWMVWILASLANMAFCRLFGGDFIAMAIVLIGTLAGYKLKQVMLEDGQDVRVLLFRNRCGGLRIRPKRYTGNRPRHQCPVSDTGHSLHQFRERPSGRTLYQFIQPFHECHGTDRLFVGRLVRRFITHEYQMALTMMTYLFNILQDGFFAAIAAIGFASISNPPRQAYKYCALIAALGHATRYVLTHNAYGEMHLIGASFIASLVIGVLTVFLAPRAKCPAETFSFPALLPMIPGMYAYRTIEALLLCLTNQEEHAFNHYFYLLSYNGLTCTFIILGMVVGATLPIFLFKNTSFKATR